MFTVSYVHSFVVLTKHTQLTQHTGTTSVQASYEMFRGSGMLLAERIYLSDLIVRLANGPDNLLFVGQLFNLVRT